jgi:hypothetical protein
MARKIEAAFKNAGNRSIKQICLKRLTGIVGTLPDGYLKLYPLPQVPTKQSAPTSKIYLPPYIGLSIAIPTLRRIVGPAIAKAQIPW